MSTNAARRELRDEHGSSYIELLLVLPLLLFVAFGCFEYSQFLNKLQLATSLSREIANMSYRECLANAEWIAHSDNGSSVDVSDCLRAVQDSLLQNDAIADALSSAQIILSVYSYDTGSEAVLSHGTVARLSYCQTGSRLCESRYSVDVFSENHELSDAVKAFQTVVTAEVLLPVESFLSGADGRVRFLPEVIYGTTIL